MTVTLTINNPSASAHLTIESQDRKSAPAVSASAPAPAATAPTFAEREALVAHGEEMIETEVNGRKTHQPRYQVQGCSHIFEWLTKLLAQQDARPEPSAPKGVRVTDSWDEPRPFTGVAAHGSVQLTLHDRRRFIVKCSEDVGIQVTNPSRSQAIALKTRDAKTGQVANASIVHPARDFQNTGAVNANKQHGAVLELLPT
jgi:hypothetical protein